MRLAWLLLAALALVAAGCRSGTKAGGQREEETVILSIATHDAADRDLAEYIAAVSRLSGGSIRFELKEGWRSEEVESDRGTVADVRAGKVDLAKVGVGSLDTLGVDDFQAVMAPFLVDGLGVEEKLLTSDLPAQMLVGVDRLRVRGVAMLPGEPRRPFGLTRRLLAASDYRNAVIGSAPSTVSVRTFLALDATTRGYLPRNLPPWDYDGAELDLLTLDLNRYDAPGSSLTANVAFWPRAFVVVANRNVFANLTASQRRALRDGGSEAVVPAVTRLRAEDREEAAILCRRGALDVIAATPTQVATLRAAVRPVYVGLERDPQTRSFIRAIEAMKRRPFAADASHCPQKGAGRKTRPAANPPARETVATPLDGTWEMAVSVAQVIGITHSPDGAEADAGRYRLVLRRGHASSFHLGDENGSSSGAFSVRGNVVLFRYANETLVYRWNVYRDTLTLRYLPGRETGPPNPTFAPWHRVGG
jgi:TRAP-type C4-dicarboxylate transport system substrate-binding protein